MLGHVGSFQLSALPFALLRRATLTSGGAILYNHTAQRVTPYSTAKRDKRPEPPNPKLQKLTMKLRSGHKLGYAIFGREDGFPLLYFHGFPGCRLEAEMFHYRALDRGVKVIGIDRPGIGLSSYQRGRRIKDWPINVGELVSKLSIRECSVLGISGGGPYALACGTGIPTGDGVIIPDTVGVQSGADPPEIAGKRHHLSEMQVRAWLRATWMQTLLRYWFPNSEWLQKAFPYSSTRATQFRQGIRGLALDDVLLRHPWGFELSEVKSVVKMWHGEKDANASIEGAKWIKKRLPKATLIQETGGDHWSQTYHAFVGFFNSLVPAGSKTKSTKVIGNTGADETNKAHKAFGASRTTGASKTAVSKKPTGTSGPPNTKPPAPPTPSVPSQTPKGSPNPRRSGNPGKGKSK